MHQLLIYAIVLHLLLLNFQNVNCLFGIGTIQSVGARGMLLCHGEPARNIRVGIYDDGIFFDDFVAENRTNADGFFEVFGTITAYGNIDPKLNVYHECDPLVICYRVFSVWIPRMFVTRTSKTERYFDIGTFDLMLHPVSESRDCIKKVLHRSQNLY